MAFGGQKSTPLPPREPEVPVAQPDDPKSYEARRQRMIAQTNREGVTKSILTGYNGVGDAPNKRLMG